MKLSEKAQVTRDKILEAASDLFYLHGYNATGLEKVIQAASVTKGNFYYYFKSKEELAVHTLDHQFMNTTQQIEEMLSDKQRSPLQSLFAILEMMSAKQKAQKKESHISGCYFGNFTLELSAESKAVRNKVKSIFDQFLNNFETLLKAARDADEISKNIDPVVTSAIILSQMEGAILLDKADQESGNVDKSIKFIKQFLTA
ncbi:MAG: TetR/AcrR family transcriptional regulator [Thiotrichaceae bacterium]